MNAGIASEVESQSSASSVLRTLALCDLVDSTGLIERMGDLAAAELIRKHDRLARTLADRHHGREIDKTDGFMMMFERPVQAVAFALDYLRGLKQLNAAEDTDLSARVGIHVGDVVVWGNSAEDVARGAKLVEVEGLVKPVTSRLMNLALPGQILLSNIAYSLAHRAQGELGDTLDTLRWRSHGSYRFRGVPDPVPVFEVGEDGLAPLKAPPWSSKAHREMPFWRRPATVVFEALVVVALVGIPLVMFLRPDPAIAFAKRDWVVVGSLHNLTGESVFDDALESALRIGLEQSRYVNVLPDLKVRDTITRMQRDPDKTEVDREVGSEVAIRDGARALILPTIAEIGGRVRVTAEVIDPQTQTTVYSETADGIGKESILPSLDTINNRLRVRLGEALATVSNESMPLEKVATKNLDALRAYTLGTREYDHARFEGAARYYRQSLTIDPDFALARIGLAKVLIIHQKNSDAEDVLKLAAALHDRVTPRDKLYVQAMLSSVNGGSQRAALDEWKMLTETYPDFPSGQSLHAYYLWVFGNQIEMAIDPAQASISPQNGNPRQSQLLLGTLFLATEKYDAASKQYEDAELLSMPQMVWVAAVAKAASRKFDEADTLLPLSKMESLGDDSDSLIARAAISIDEGKADEALKMLDGRNPELVLARLGASILLAEPPDTRQWAEIIDSIALALEKAKPAERERLQYRLLLSSYFAARVGKIDAAEKAIRVSGPEPSSGGYPILSNLLVVAQAEISRIRGKSPEAKKALIDKIDGNEIFLTHVALMDAHIANSDHVLALDQARWLINHRGRAYAELNVPGVLPFNVGMSGLASLNAAESAIALGDKRLAQSFLAQFDTQWRQNYPTRDLAARVTALKKKLQ